MNLAATTQLDRDEFNSIHNEFFRALGIQARICRSDLLVEIEAMAILYRGPEA